MYWWLLYEGLNASPVIAGEFSLFWNRTTFFSFLVVNCAATVRGEVEGKQALLLHTPIRGEGSVL
jgi:hypothetical protein